MALTGAQTPTIAALDYGPGGGTIGSGDHGSQVCLDYHAQFQHSLWSGASVRLECDRLEKASRRLGVQRYHQRGIGTGVHAGGFEQCQLNGDFTQRPNGFRVFRPNVAGGQRAGLVQSGCVRRSRLLPVRQCSVGSLRGPALINADWALSKDFIFGSFLNRETTRIQIRAEAFNVWNNTNLGLPNANVDQASAGQITALQSTMREWNSELISTSRSAYCSRYSGDRRAA